MVIGPLTAIDLAALALALLLIRLARHAGMWIFALVALPGTALHELSHFFVALVLGGSPSFPSLLPTRTERGWRMGHVQFRGGHLRAMFVGMAPLLLAPLAWWWATTFGSGTNAPGISRSCARWGQAWASTSSRTARRVTPRAGIRARAPATP